MAKRGERSCGWGGGAVGGGGGDKEKEGERHGSRGKRDRGDKQLDREK